MRPSLPLLAALFATACTTTTAPDLSKDEARAQAAKGDQVIDFCDELGWYGDGICDDFCLLPDPDCFEMCGDGTDVLCAIDVFSLQPCPVGQIREVVDHCIGQCVDATTCEPPPLHPGLCGDGTPTLCLALPPECPDGLVPELVNHCYGQCVDPMTCLPPPVVLPECGDGSAAVCEMVPPVCPDGLVSEIVNGCFGECVDPVSCEPPIHPGLCGDGSQAICLMLPPECPAGLTPEVVNGCYGECVDPMTCLPPPTPL